MSVGEEHEVGRAMVDDEGKLEDVDSEAALLQRQRKEKKELQAKITSMKHGIPKNDRAKKKEIANEIARTEAELATRHQAELAEFKQRKSKGEQPATLADDQEDQNDQNHNAVVSEEGDHYDTNAVPDSAKPKKITKAQKRRDKKETKAKERETTIAESIQAVKQGVRYKEEQSFKTVLSSKRLSFHQVPADGDCLYNALAHQLSLCGLSTQVSNLRQHAASIMKSNRDDYLPFLTNSEGDMLSQEEFNEYCENLLKSGVWGGHPELVAISTYYQRPIEVLQSDAAPIMIGEQFIGRAKPLTITYHRHAFRLGEHYNSTAPAKEGAAEEPNDI